ncbi:Uncharacterized protein FWK35_00029107 [Aphis craccivora]|uniref:DUF7869 domain-containing protein n=1 Tax=Aphis craccivora TaxID=307492 RepID=A0A6G0VWQ3_APHCR|nr:Uncharacterized protein FWK35_00029107 [Aphis craccivora]
MKDITLVDFIDTPNCLNDDQDIRVPNVDEDFLVEGGIAGMRKRRMTGNKKHNHNIKLSEIKNQNQMDKHPLILKTCTGKCKRQCHLFSHENQASIWSEFWKLNYTDRRKYMSKCINLVSVKRRKQSTLTHPEFKIEIAICKSTFLQTLDYTNDSIVTELVAVMEKDLCGQFIKENRETYRSTIKIQNISLNKPKADDCEDCEILNQDITNPESNSTLVLHKMKANKANAEYKKDSQEQELGSTRYFSMDLQKFVFWADNCTAQNKNWTLYSALVTAVNQINGPNVIIIKYLTKGHTHMSADGIHGNIESKMRKKGKIYVFDDLTDTVAESRMKQIDDPLFNFKLINVVLVRFVKESNCLEYKNDFDDNLIKLDFLTKSTLRNINCLPNHEDSQRGINSSKKKDIIKTLVPLIPENRRHFWENLPESNVTDLLHDEDYGLSNSLVI